MLSFNIKVEQFQNFSYNSKIHHLPFFLVNGNWGKWGSFGSCNKPCGTGIQQRSRSCTNPKPDHGGKSCPGSSINSRYCNTHKCPGLI